MPVITKPKAPVKSGCIAIAVGLVILLLILAGLDAATRWAGPMPKESDALDQAMVPHTRAGTPAHGQ